jgi:hypothetical protein
MLDICVTVSGHDSACRRSDGECSAERENKSVAMTISRSTLPRMMESVTRLVTRDRLRYYLGVSEWPSNDDQLTCS